MTLSLVLYRAMHRRLNKEMEDHILLKLLNTHLRQIISLVQWTSDFMLIISSIKIKITTLL